MSRQTSCGSFETEKGTVIDGLTVHHGAHMSIVDSELKGKFTIQTAVGFVEHYIIKDTYIHDASISLPGYGQDTLEIIGGSISNATFYHHWNDNISITNTIISDTVFDVNGSFYFKNVTIGDGTPSTMVIAV